MSLMMLGGTSYITDDDLTSLELYSPRTDVDASCPDSRPPTASSHDRIDGGRVAAATGASATSANAHTPPTSQPCYSEKPLPPRKQVSFCPLALLIECAADCKITKAASTIVCGAGGNSSSNNAGRIAAAAGATASVATSTNSDYAFAITPTSPVTSAANRNKPRIGVKTYCLDLPNASKATAKAWQAVCTNLSTGLQPLLSPGAGSAGSRNTVTYSSNRARESSPERDQDRKMLARSRSDSASSLGSSRGSFSSTGKYDLDDEDEDERHGRTGDVSHSPGFIPNAPSRITIKLPSLQRRGTLPSSGSLCPIRSCLKARSASESSSKSCQTEPDVESPTIAYPSKLSTFPTAIASPASSRTTRSTPCISPVESAPMAHRALMASHLSPDRHALSIPLTDCCERCSQATEVGLCADEEYEEPWSKAAMRKRKFDVKRKAGVVNTGEDATKCDGALEEVLVDAVSCLNADLGVKRATFAGATKTTMDLVKIGDEEEEEVGVPTQGLMAAAVVDELGKTVIVDEPEEDGEPDMASGEEEGSALDNPATSIEPWSAERSTASADEVGEPEAHHVTQATTASATKLITSPPVSDIALGSPSSEPKFLSAADILPPQVPVVTPIGNKAPVSSSSTRPAPTKRKLSLLNFGKGIVDAGFVANFGGGSSRPFV
ncbi:BZ3500_MvSof-1268-A1-R1_Chr1-2g01296 [Microbotryum saponariae]|uniref:BZ3500_MvSof-1268-A1-R1_Chr1-2g01296 protein n=1 Tax=Microbotryum saponariae TaxID=289078 RepID=A0A2X0KVC2_9BASI|nr:BZ3500_MvSof-1268-A1-R1_Chr1-2g01296 [Microbotryum saponariae]SCZ97007.1 BZ3501_MvSof-1269-A2-R1_Chr1-2g00894 [Microbotryum saponariae]